MLAILKKELKSYFYSPIGYVVIGIFLFCFSVIFRYAVLYYGSVDLNVLYWYNSVYGLTIIIPILTMRMFSEERKSGTEQLILTSPIGMFKVIMGKLFAGIIVILITLLISSMFYFIVSYFGEPNLATTLVSILGFILVSFAALSFGIFASSLTENQIIAGIITIAFLIISYITAWFSLINYYISFASGIISIEDVISLLLFSAVFISLTLIVMQRRKLVK